jgi:hypothetical protein
MKSTIFCSCLVAILFATAPAKAGVIDVPDVTIGGSPYRAFQDTTTSLTWLDLDNFATSNETYNTIVTLLIGSGFHVATTAELLVLEASIPAVPANFSAEAPIVGGNYAGSPYLSGSRNLIWGLYDDGDPTLISWAWKFDTDTTWQSTVDAFDPNSALSSVNAAPDQDLGIWIVGTGSQSVPEPGTMFLFGLGAVGLAVARRRIA